MSSIPSSGGTGAGNSSSPPQMVPVAIVAGSIICIVGGFVTGYLLTKETWLGIALFGVGTLAGFVSRKITGGASRLAGQCLVAACVLSFCLAMVGWYRWGLTLPDENGKQRDPTWQEAIARAPRLLLVQFGAPRTLLISGLCAAFGAAEAFRQAGRRYRLVAVVED